MTKLITIVSAILVATTSLAIAGPGRNVDPTIIKSETLRLTLVKTEKPPKPEKPDPVREAQRQAEIEKWNRIRDEEARKSAEERQKLDNLNRCGNTHCNR